MTTDCSPSDDKMLAIPEKISILPFGSDKSVTFSNIQESINWIEKEQTAWKSFTERGINLQGIPRSYTHPIRNHSIILNNAVNQMVALRDAQDKEGNSEKYIREFYSILREFENPPYVYSGSKAGQFIVSLPEDKILSGIFVLALWQNHPLPGVFAVQGFDPVTALRGAALLTAKDYGTSAEAARRRKTIAKGMERWEAEFSRLAEHAQAFLSNAETETSDALRKHMEAGRALDALVADRQEQLNELEAERHSALKKLEEERAAALDDLLSERKDALTKLEETYREHLRLKAPADYWATKADRHRNAAKRWLWAIIALAVIGIGATSIAYWYLLSWLDGLKSSSVATASLVLLALPALLYATLVRMAHRSYRDEVRHADDAEQRTTLVQTYLALTHEKNPDGIQPGERLLALHALFRGSAQSDSPDDTPPLNALEALLQGLKPKAGS